MHPDRISPPRHTRWSPPTSFVRYRHRYHARAPDVLCLATGARGLNEQMPAPAHRHLRPVGTSRVARARECRTVGCSFASRGILGFCGVCEAVYHAARELRELLLARRGAQPQAARPDLCAGMAPTGRDRLLAHVAAQGAHRGRHPTVLELAGLEDFLAELREIGLHRRECG